MTSQPECHSSVVCVLKRMAKRMEFKAATRRETPYGRGFLAFRRGYLWAKLEFVGENVGFFNFQTFQPFFSNKYLKILRNFQVNPVLMISERVDMGEISVRNSRMASQYRTSRAYACIMQLCGVRRMVYTYTSCAYLCSEFSV